MTKILFGEEIKLPPVTVERMYQNWVKVRCGESEVVIMSTWMLGTRIDLAKRRVQRQERRRIERVRKSERALEKHGVS